MNKKDKSAHRKQVEALELKAISPIKAIREKCFECQGKNWHSVKNCQETACPNWPFHLGFNPFRKPQSGRTVVIANLNQKGHGESPIDNHQDAISPTGRGKVAPRRIALYSDALEGIEEKLDEIKEMMKGKEK